MMDPATYSTKNPHTVEAMQYDAWGETAEDVKTWISSLLETSFSAEDILLNDNGNGAFEIYVGEDFLFRVESGQYVYLDEDGFHATSKGAFEMIYRKVVEPT